MEIKPSVLHEITPDIQEALLSSPTLLEKRNNLTPLARNEWICRVTIVKKDETRASHIRRMGEDLLKGKKRPCCRPGCPHRRESAKKRFR